MTCLIVLGLDKHLFTSRSSHVKMAMGEMPDELDSRLLLELQRNARRSFKEIASEVKTPVAAATNRVKALEEKGIIRGYSALVDPKKLGYETAILELLVSRGKLLDVERARQKFNGLPSLRCHQRDRRHSCLHANSRLEANLVNSSQVVASDVQFREDSHSCGPEYCKRRPRLPE